MCVCVCIYTYNDIYSRISCIVLKERRQLLIIYVFSEGHTHSMTQVSLGGWENVFRVYRRACTLGVYVCVCVYTVRCKSSSSPSDCQTVLLQLRTALLLLFLPWLTLQVLSSLSSPPLLLPLFFFFSSLFLLTSSFSFFLDLVGSARPLLFCPHSLNSCQQREWLTIPLG